MPISVPAFHGARSKPALPCDTCTGCHLPPDLVRHPNQPIETDHVYGGIFVKAWAVPDAGTILPQHSHPFAHMTFVSAGATQVWRDGEFLGEFHAPAAVEIPAFAKHEFRTLEPSTTLLCLHNVTDTGGSIEIAVRNDLVGP